MHSVTTLPGTPGQREALRIHDSVPLVYVASLYRVLAFGSRVKPAKYANHDEENKGDSNVPAQLRSPCSPTAWLMPLDHRPR